MGMSEDQILKNTARILDGIELTGDVRAALIHLVKTAETATPFKDQRKTAHFYGDTQHPFGQVSWMLKYCNVTEDQIRTCLSNAALPLPGGIEITPGVRTKLDDMVEEAIREDTLDWANSTNLVHLDARDSSVKEFLNSSVEKSVNELIETSINEVKSAGPHYQFSWLLNNYRYDEGFLIECIRPDEYDKPSEPEM